MVCAVTIFYGDTGRARVASDAEEIGRILPQGTMWAWAFKGMATQYGNRRNTWDPKIQAGWDRIVKMKGAKCEAGTVSAALWMGRAIVKLMTECGALKHGDMEDAVIQECQVKVPAPGAGARLEEQLRAAAKKKKADRTLAKPKTRAESAKTKKQGSGSGAGGQGTGTKRGREGEADGNSEGDGQGPSKRKPGDRGTSSGDETTKPAKTGGSGAGSGGDGRGDDAARPTPAAPETRTPVRQTPGNVNKEGENVCPTVVHAKMQVLGQIVRWTLITA